ncbi:hypothetical protein ACLNGM_06705 [Aureimonas phyllosphaerae]|uniref:hypothetical protein n=1 Tax=Aureimonas phyllosphaerae TaxID=1166078 RepID=UPI003A5C4C3E
MDFSKLLSFGKVSLTNSDDTLTSLFYKNAAVHGLDGNDVFQTPDSGGVITSSDFFGGNGDDRLIVNENTGLLFGSKFDGGAGIDTLELTSDKRIVMSSEGTGDATAVTVKSYAFGFIPTGSLTGESVERYIIKASGYQDVLVGGAGNDFLDGRGGLDIFKGSAGDDSYVFDTVGEKVTGEAANGGHDQIFTTVSVKLGDAGADNANIESLRLVGDAAINGTGNSLNNLITGNAADNVIAGGAGNDRLYGNGGVDKFVFAEAGAGNRDGIFDFGADDVIVLDRSQGAFTGLTAVNGALDPADLQFNTAVGTDAQLIYNRATGILSYDENGTGAGGSQEIAFIGANVDLKAEHILLA